MRQVLISFAVIFFILSSCNKDTNPVVPVIPTDSIILLKQFIILDPLLAPHDTVKVFSYTYDNLNRCTHITTKEGGAVFEENIYYNNNDTLMAWHELIYPAGQVIREYFTYNSNGHMITDSLYNGNAVMCVYDGTGNIIHSIINSNSLPFLKGSYMVNKDSRGNIINSADSTFQYQLSGYSFRAIIYITVSYDDHPNPFYKLYPKRLTEIELEHAFNNAVAPFYRAIIQPNNILQEDRLTAPVGIFSTFSNRYTYQYNSNSYPSAVQFHNLLTGQIYQGVYLY